LALPHSGVFSLFAGSLFTFLWVSLSLPPFAPPAGKNDDEEDDDSSDTASDRQGQKEKFGERGCK